MSNYLLEIGVEEFPAKRIKSTQVQLVEGMKNLLEDHKYTCEEIGINSTPRRFAMIVKNIEASESQTQEKIKGPAKKIALDQEGKPSKALQGFMRSKGLDFKDVYFEDLNGVEYAFANIEHKLESVKDILTKGVPEIIKIVTNPRAMRWGGKKLRFLRPIRWIVSLLDDEVLNFDLEGIRVGRITKGHRTLGKSEIVIDKIENYEKLLEDNYVIVDEEKRRNIIVKGINRLAKEKGGNYISDEGLLDEIVNINEYPTPFIGNFDEDYLKLPKEVIVTPMKDHQRYFPIENDNKTLLPYFISVRNGDSKGIDNVARGNEKVLVARLEDAKFFYDLDIQKKLEEYIEDLDHLGYHDGLGNMRQKAERLVKLVNSIGGHLDISSDAIEHAKRAAYLSKADLVSKLVVEFTELQGTMGRIYARASGENKMVAQAIEEQYLPRFAGDKIPESTAGILLSLADKIDTITGLYSLGIEVTGSQDPYGQRRAVIGILNILIDNKMNLDLKESFRDSLYNFADEFGQNFDYEETMKKLVDFTLQRFRNKLIDEGHRYDIVDSVLGDESLDPYVLATRVESVEKLLEDDQAEDIITRFVRIKNISKTAKGLELDSQVLEEGDLILYNKLSILEEMDSQVADCDERLKILSDMTADVDQYLDNTMINVDDKSLKEARLSLIKNFSARIERIFDPSLIVRS